MFDVAFSCKLCIVIYTTNLRCSMFKTDFRLKTCDTMAPAHKKYQIKPVIYCWLAWHKSNLVDDEREDMACFLACFKLFITRSSNNINLTNKISEEVKKGFQTRLDLNTQRFITLILNSALEIYLKCIIIIHIDKPGENFLKQAD